MHETSHHPNDELDRIMADYRRALSADEEDATECSASLPSDFDAQAAEDCLRKLHHFWHPGADETNSFDRDWTPFNGAGAESETPWSRIGRYEIVRELGRGGGGVVFLARDPTLHRDVALKLARPDTLRAWDRERRHVIAQTQHGNAALLACVLPGSTEVVCGTLRGSLMRWNFDTGVKRLLPSKLDRVHSLAAAPDGKSILVGTNARIYRIDTTDGAVLETLDPRGAETQQVAVSAQGRWLAAVGHFNAVSVRDRRSDTEFLLEGHMAEPTTLAFVPGEKLLVSGGYDETARWWSLDERRELATFAGNNQMIDLVAVSPDGRTLAVNFNEPPTIVLWDLRTYRRLLTIDLPRTARGLAFAPDGKTLIATIAHHNGKGQLLEWTCEPPTLPEAE